MLELKEIKKDYPAGDGIVHALKGVSLKFRRSEFVSILGPSGCGKTTMLNIIGGLDQYTSGDLVINGKSTKRFKDRDWDTYRNHSIGFVFQSYNLIPHQTVLQNVEIALTLSGVSKSERTARAKKALEEVGLANQIHKKPSQMSGGQMQRVAIARALVNNPDIILADEPTGALDSETSVQVMDILKEISKSRLIIMVTHNPDLAEKYSTRIIRMLDGEIKDDSAPLSEEEIRVEESTDHGLNEGKKKKKKPEMKLGSAFYLSFKNLLSKKTRTLLTAFAGSVGIIGIALILSVSEGLTGYIDAIQEETLSSYPLMIQKSETDMSTLLETFMGIAQSEVAHEKDAIYTKQVIYDLIDAFNNLETQENDLKSFKVYLEDVWSKKDEEDSLGSAISGIQYGYDLDLLVYTKNVDGNIIHSDTEELLTELMGEYMDVDMMSMMDMRESMMGSSGMSSMMPSQSGMNLWQEMLPGENGAPVSEILKKQYDVIYGSWPNSYDEVVLVVDENNELDDMTLYALGLETKEAAGKIIKASMNQEEVEFENKSWSYEEICSSEYRTILNSECYSYDENTGLYTDLRETDTGLKYLYDNATVLKVTGIIRPKDDVKAPMLTGSIAYTSGLTEYVIENAQKSDVIKAQLEDASTDVFTGLPFKSNTGDLTDAQKETELKAYLEGLNQQEKAENYVRIKGIPSEEQLLAAVEQAMMDMNREKMEETMIQAMTQQMGMGEAEITSYLEDMDDEELTGIFTEMVTEQVKIQFTTEVATQMAAMPVEQLAAGLDMELETYTKEQCALYYDEIMTFSDSTYEDNLIKMGRLDLDSPSTINIYASTFKNKDVIEEIISNYNEGKDELEQIKYTDYIGIMMSSITSIINMISYVLIAFVSISLVVSSIMIAIITLISVQERTKEIGILRAIGASKKNVSSMFTMETLIIGFASGLLGVGVTMLLCIPINAIIYKLTEISGLKANLPLEYAAILVLISMVLTLISGIIPSRSAAKKDPVVALRTE